MLKLKNKLRNKFKSAKIECLPDDFSVISYDVQSESSPAPAPTASDGSNDDGYGAPPGSYNGDSSSPSTNDGRTSGSSMNYNCCYNYNFNINYNFSPPPHGCHDGRGNDDEEEIFEEEWLRMFDSNSNLVSESSAEPTKKANKAAPTRKAPRCLSTSDLSTYKGSAFSEDCESICSRLNSVKITEMLDQKGANLTDHDRRILHCMVLKRIKEIERLEESVLAKQCWEQEKLYRKTLLDEQERNYKKAIRQKRTIEQIEIRNRKQRLERLEQQQIERIQNEISEKDIRSSSLLKTLVIQKGIKECEKKNRELKRIEDATINQEEKILDKDIWRQSLVDHLEERVQRADVLRHRVLEVNKRRIKIDNQLEKRMHAHNLKQTLEQEKYKLVQLQERIMARESRYEKFKASKKRIFDQLKSRAKTTAALRDMVKHSISPDTCGKVAIKVGPGSAHQHRVIDVVQVK
ncbi:hypothetical protein quinque_006881 [Culex quinquefasciatus]